MNTYIIDNLDTIKIITGKSTYKKIVLHIDDENKIAKYESDYTLYELTERLDYNKVKLIEENF